MVACWRDDEDNRLQIRDHLSRKYAFGVPGNDALDCLARYGPLVEIGAGTGYWARCLRERGVDIFAYDVIGDAWRSWSVHPSWRRFDAAAPVRLWLGRTRSARSLCSGRRSSKAGRKSFGAMLSEPSCCAGRIRGAFDEASLLAYPGEHVALLGEPGEEGPGSEGFQARLRRSWWRIEAVPVPRWHSSKDRLFVYARR
jgi:hypothetical protein